MKKKQEGGRLVNGLGWGAHNLVFGGSGLNQDSFTYDCIASFHQEEMYAWKKVFFFLALRSDAISHSQGVVCYLHSNIVFP